MISSYSSDLVKGILQASEKLAVQYRYDHVNSEHILLAIVDESLKSLNEDNTVIKVFKRLKTDPLKLIADIEASFDPQQATFSAEKLPLTEKAEQIFTNSSLEARLLYSYLIEAEHILLAYLQIGSPFSENVLITKYNLNYEVVRKAIRTIG